MVEEDGSVMDIAASVSLYKPLLKWAGGKRWLVPTLRPLWQRFVASCPNGRLVEPFCGGLAVTLGLLPRRALLNDVNPHLIHFYRAVQRGLTIDMPMENDAGLYYQHRDRFNALIRQGQADSDEAAALFYYLNKTGYNGLCRFNKQGLFNVPFGKYKRITYQRDFHAYREVFAAWEFRCGDFETVKVRPGDFVYADPPYDVVFRQYAAEGFSWQDQERLARWLASLDVPVAVSNQATDRIVELYRSLGFTVYFLQGPRMISCTGDRSAAREVLAVKGLVSSGAR
ncbi:DNA adenine methylase [Alicyclobacillus cellulosilyticus]|uniref:DNA adenine methylase n=1 Tax=Alicyclobacillus cellulosilyticus TaxID=1003997 RepID=UPI001E65BEB7|nr:Dam family site-specific DNA-(adenine-N6)-methyltransferase [Alicyclobacillus cellulosilyticus]